MISNLFLIVGIIAGFMFAAKNNKLARQQDNNIADTVATYNEKSSDVQDRIEMSIAIAMADRKADHFANWAEVYFFSALLCILFLLIKIGL
ncbi:MAG: hypothetical protein IJD52_02975 [Alphaproteobacteria bacterium]|nr:hypothetical protein [Alphaproteobacteria bacterium]